MFSPAQIPWLFAAAAALETKMTVLPPASARAGVRCFPGLFPAAFGADWKASPAFSATNFQLYNLWVFLLIKDPQSPQRCCLTHSPADCTDRLWGRDCFISKCCLFSTFILLPLTVSWAIFKPLNKESTMKKKGASLQRNTEPPH